MSHFSKIHNRSSGGKKKNLSASNFCYHLLINQSHPLNQVTFPLSSPKRNQVLTDADELNPQHNAKHDPSEGNRSDSILKGPMFTTLLSALTLWVQRKSLSRCELIIKRRRHKRKEKSQGSLNMKKKFETLYSPVYAHATVISQPTEIYFPLCLQGVGCKVVLDTVNVYVCMCVHLNFTGQL